MARLEGTGSQQPKKNDRRKEVQQMIQAALAGGDFASGRTISPALAPVGQPEWPVNPLHANIPKGTTPKKENPMSSPPAQGVDSTGNPHRDWIIQKESSGNPRAKNPNSSAFGLGQLIRANREAYAKRFGFSPETTNPQEQLQMMDAYVQERYGSYENARKFWENNNWY